MHLFSNSTRTPNYVESNPDVFLTTTLWLLEHSREIYSASKKSLHTEFPRVLCPYNLGILIPFQ